MSSRDKLILQMLMLDSGIIPYDGYPFSAIDMGAIDKRISSLDPSSRREVKRRFRKLWRKSAKCLDAALEESGRLPVHKKACGFKTFSEPTSSQKKARRLAVILYLRGLTFSDNN